MKFTFPSELRPLPDIFFWFKLPAEVPTRTRKLPMSKGGQSGFHKIDTLLLIRLVRQLHTAIAAGPFLYHENRYLDFRAKQLCLKMSLKRTKIHKASKLLITNIDDQ